VTHAREHHPPPLRDQVREHDRDAGRQRQAGAEPLEQGGERRDDLPQDDPHDADRDQDHRGGVDHRGADRRAQLHDLLDVDGQALQDRVQDTARLAGGAMLQVVVVEGLRLLRSVGQVG
jgi:hypothetical protein